MNFSDIEWGPDEAKGDSNLSRYFIHPPFYEAIVAGDTRYVTGRKGTGKTAIAEYIKDKCEDDPQWFNASLSLKNFPLQNINSFADKSFRDKSKFVPIWSFLILVEIANLIALDCSSSPSESVFKIKQFLSENHFDSEVGFANSISILKSSGAKISVGASWLGVSAEDREDNNSFIKVHYQKAADFLIREIKNINSSSMYFIFFDELDEGYRAKDSSLRLILLALFRSVENVYLELSSNVNIRPLVLIRSDIFNGLEDNDLNKLDDYVEELDWTKYSSKTSYNLKSVVNARITASFDSSKCLDYWPLVTSEEKMPPYTDSLWNYITVRTFERPRDIIKFMKHCQKIESGSRLTFETVKKAELEYSKWLYRELRDEIHSHLPVWAESLQCISNMSLGRFDQQEFSRKLCDHVKIKEWLAENNETPHTIIKTLFDFSVIGHLHRSGRWIFKYKDHDLDWDSEAEVIVHFGFYKKLRLKWKSN